MKRAQMEIMGLALIMILVILGFVFGMRFLKSDDTTLGQDFEQKTMATSFLNTMLGTTSNCHSATFRELIQDCAQGAQVRCPSGRDSCDETRNDVSKMLQEVLVVRKQGFKLIARGPGAVAESLTIESDNPCTGEIVAGVQNIPTRLGTSVEIVLQICK